MLLNRAIGAASLAVVGIALLLIPAGWASAQRATGVARAIEDADGDLVPRRPLPKIPSAQLKLPDDSTGEIVVKFKDNVRARVQAGVLDSNGHVNVAQARAIMARFQLTAEPLFTWSEQRLSLFEDRAAAASGKAQPDLAGMIKLTGPRGNLEAAARALNDLNTVEWVSFRTEMHVMAEQRCCFPDTGVCSEIDPTDCAIAGGTPGSAGSDCTTISTPPVQGEGECGPGACCITDTNQCVNTFDEGDCLAQGGVYQGWQTDCLIDEIECGLIGCGDSMESCFSQHFEPACQDTDCCELVCSLKAICCETIWDTECASLANLHCITPGPPDGPDRCASPDNGDCYQVHFTGGCFDPTCCHLVCDIDPFCCDVLQFWDLLCVATAQDVCGEPPAPGTTPLLTARQGYLRENSYAQQAGGTPSGVSGQGQGWNLRGNNYDLWVINEINADTGTGAADANLDSALDEGDQFVEIVNNFDIDLLIAGWEIWTEAGVIGDPGLIFPLGRRHVFPAGTVVPANGAIVVFGAIPPDPGAPAFGGAVVQAASETPPTGVTPLGLSVPDTADRTATVQLLNAEGVLMTQYRYGEEADNLTSINRSPDVLGPDGGLAPAAAVTPGTRSDGMTAFGPNYEGLYGVSRELFEQYQIGETIPPGSTDYANIRYNARGKGIRVGVIEAGFYPGHEDLHVTVEPGQTILVIPETRPEHGTACMGIINGQENAIGVTGVAPEADLWFFPTISVEEGPRTEAAFLSAYDTFDAGDIVSCSFGPVGNLNNDLVTWTLIRAGSDLGITTCVAAGDDCLNLSQVVNLGDSGAVVVGSGDPGFPRCRRLLSNFFNSGDFNDDSNVIHCQAWGAGVTTCGYPAPGTDPTRSYTSTFNGTSAAAAQTAGMAACLQGLAKQFYGIHLGPPAIRGALATGFLQCGFGDPDDLPGFPAILPCGLDTDPDSGPNKIGIYPRPGRGDGTSAQTVLSYSGFGHSPHIDSLSIVTGQLIQGNIYSLKGSDDNYLIIQSAQANPNGVGSPGHSGGIALGQTTMFQLIGHMESNQIQSLEVGVEAFVDNGSGVQLIYMYDWQINSWLAVAVNFLGVGDPNEVTLFPIENGSRFIRANDFKIKLRVQTVALGVGGDHRSFTDWVTVSRGLGDTFISSGP